MRARGRYLPWLFAVLFNLPLLTARADSWPLPAHEVILSANSSTRVNIWPRELENHIAYFNDLVENTEKPGQAAGRDKVQSAVAVVESRTQSGQWQIAWVQKLSNDVGPATALVSNNGQYIVTFDNWHNAGYGNNVIVIYRATGNHTHYRLSDFLPDFYISALPVTISSRWWRCDAQIDPDDTHVSINFLIPSGVPTEPDQGCIRFRIRLSDGVIILPESEVWGIAIQQSMTAYFAHIADFSSKILYFHTDIVKTTENVDYVYLRELGWRITSLGIDDYIEAIVYQPKRPNDFCSELLDIKHFGTVIMLTSASTDAAMLSSLSRCDLRKSDNNLNNMQIYFAIDPTNDRLFLNALAAKGVSRANGAEINFVDTKHPIRQRPDRLIAPEQLKEYYDNSLD